MNLVYLCFIPLNIMTLNFGAKNDDDFGIILGLIGLFCSVAGLFSLI